MSRSIHIFKSFEEQEMFFLQHFFQLSPSGRLQALARLQQRNNRGADQKSDKKVTIRKHFVYGH